MVDLGSLSDSAPMSTILSPVQRALAAGTRAELDDALGPGRPSLTLPEIQRLTACLETLAEVAVPLRVGILHTYTSDLLGPYIRFEALAQGLEAEIYHGPYGAVIQEANPTSGLVGHERDLTVILLRWEDLDPALRAAAIPTAEVSNLTERATSRFLQQVQAVRATVCGHLLVTLLPVDREPTLGDYDVAVPNSEHRWRESFKGEIAARLRATCASTTLLDVDQSLAVIGGERFFDRR